MARTAPCCTSATSWVGTACWRAKRSGVCRLVPGCGLRAVGQALQLAFPLVPGAGGQIALRRLVQQLLAGHLQQPGVGGGGPDAPSARPLQVGHGRAGGHGHGVQQVVRRNEGGTWGHVAHETDGREKGGGGERAQGPACMDNHHPCRKSRGYTQSPVTAFCVTARRAADRCRWSSLCRVSRTNGGAIENLSCLRAQGLVSESFWPGLPDRASAGSYEFVRLV
jgi:hypothetical protein